MDNTNDELMKCLVKLGINTNGGVVCDMIDGPCACGAWHCRKDWLDKIKTVKAMKDKSLFTKKSAAGKGDVPRNISRKFWDNWDKIKGLKKFKYK